MFPDPHPVLEHPADKPVFVTIGLHHTLHAAYGAICDAIGVDHHPHQPERYDHLYSVALPLKQAQALYDVVWEYVKH